MGKKNNSQCIQNLLPVCFEGINFQDTFLKTLGFIQSDQGVMERAIFLEKLVTW